MPVIDLEKENEKEGSEDMSVRPTYNPPRPLDHPHTITTVPFTATFTTTTAPVPSHQPPPRLPPPHHHHHHQNHHNHHNHQVLKRGDWDGLDDPRDVPWRLKGEELVREAVASVPGIKCYDITWNQAELQVAFQPS